MIFRVKYLALGNNKITSVPVKQPLAPSTNID